VQGGTEMLEQLFFILLSIILFGLIFFKLIYKNDTSYVPIIAIEALGIGIDFVALLGNLKMNILVKMITYLMSIILPLAIILLEKKGIDVMKSFRMIKVNIYIAIGNFKKAKDILINLEEEKQTYDVHKKLAKIYEKEGGMRKAIDEYVQCIDMNKQDYDSYYKVANLLTDLDRKDEAIQMLNNLLAKKPEYYDATIALGDLLIEKEMYKEAANIYLDALKFNPLSYDLNYNLGIAYTMLNDFKSAKECYEKAADINSLAYNAKYCLAEIALLYKDLDKAEAYFSQVLDNEELSADCYFELAKINIMRGQKDIAIKYANLAIDLDSKKIATKIKKEPLFITILTKVSIPFNLEEKEELPSFSEKEKLAKSHLEETQELTTNMGYVKTHVTENLEAEQEIEQELN
jgi:tetratricopeptide (TPR) repeat protein